MYDFDFGPLVLEDAILFRLWAPLQQSVVLKLETGKQYDMEPKGDGWFHHTLPGVGAGTLYRFQLADGQVIPDPASRFQPEDVHGPSEVVDVTNYVWKTESWSGRPWEEMVIYELHPGTFTQEGSFLAAIEKLDHLRQLGITAIQLMPTADFPGSYGWGYDGVMPYAPESSYGRPEDLLKFVDEAHARGICVFMDVVYNHFGPDGNYMPAVAPLFTEHHSSPWGMGINYDDEGSDQIREFVIQNAIYWITQFRIDGLRLDAVHQIKDDSGEHLIVELARRVRDVAGRRHVHLIVENEDNDSDLLVRGEDGQPKHFTAQWNDDVHHVLHVAATDETFGYYQEYVGNDDNIGRALAQGFVFQGEHMPYRGEARGKPSEHLSPLAFISFIQNHDQIGNRANGDRMASYIASEPLKAIAAVYLLAPQVPMLFMGEEWGAKEPFPYFCQFDEDLNEKVREGRRKEMSRLPGFDGDNVPDPTARSTFLSAKLDWSKSEAADGTEMLAFYRSLLALRHEHIVPLLGHGGLKGGTFEANGRAVKVTWKIGETELEVLANLSKDPLAIENGSSAGELLYAFGDVEADRLGPWSVLWHRRRLTYICASSSHSKTSDRRRSRAIA